jgi:hypothetical protein
MPRVVAHPSKVNTAKSNAQRGNVFLFILPPGESIAPGEWRIDFSFLRYVSRYFLRILSIILSRFSSNLRFFLVNLLTEFSVGFIYLGLQLAALFINFVTFVFFGGFSSEFSLCLIEFFIEFLFQFLDLSIMFSVELNQFSTRLI